MYTNMGRGRKGLIEQSQRKPKRNCADEGGRNWYKYYEVFDKNDPMLPKVPMLSKDFLEALKRMELKEVADILFK